MKLSFKKRVLSAVICVVALFSLTACSKDDEDTSFSTPDLPTVKTEVTAGGSVNLPAGFVAPIEAGKMSVGYTGSEIFGAVNLVSSVKTDYFTNSGSITFNFNGNLSRYNTEKEEYLPANFDDKTLMNIAVALYKKDGDYTTYIETAYMPAMGETQTATFDGLDAAAEYRFVITYTDVSRTRITGSFSATGVTTPPAPLVEDSSASGVTAG